MIIPIYNTEAWLEECLNSVCNQTLKDIEILCVNDGSTDRSLDILQKYAEYDKRIIVINQENGGVAKARNTGLKYAKGNYVLFVDSDDFIAGDALEILVREMKERALQILFFNANVIAEDGIEQEIILRETRYFRRSCEYPSKCKGEDLYRLFWENKEYIVSACLILTERRFLLQNAIAFPEGIMHEDNVFAFECLLLASEAGYLDRHLYYRRMRQGSLMDLDNPDKLLFSVFSCFVCVKLLFRFCYASECRKENEEAAFSYIKRMIIICRNRYGRLKETAKTRLLEMAGKDQYLFRVLIQSSYDSNEKIKRLGAETKRNSEKVRRLETENRELNKIITDLTNSRSYKTGRVLTWIPRKLRDMMQRLYKK